MAASCSVMVGIDTIAMGRRGGRKLEGGSNIGIIIIIIIISSSSSNIGRSNVSSSSVESSGSSGISGCERKSRKRRQGRRRCLLFLPDEVDHITVHKTIGLVAATTRNGSRVKISTAVATKPTLHRMEHAWQQRARATRMLEGQVEQLVAQSSLVRKVSKDSTGNQGGRESLG